MARVIHRRVLTKTAAKARRPRKAAQRLGPTGWFFSVVAVLWAVVELWPITQFGAFDSLSSDAQLVVRTLGDVAVVALPAGLLLGFPNARRGNPWLFRGVVLLALVQLVQPVLRALWGWVFEQVDLSAAGFSPLFAAETMLSLAVAVVSLAAVWSLSDGLFDAGARPHRIVLVAVIGVAVALEIVIVVPIVVANGLEVFPNGALDMVSIVIGSAVAAAWYVVVMRLVVGFVVGLVPRRAWALGAGAGVLFIVETLAATVLLWTPQASGSSMDIRPLLLAASSAVWVLLFLALALGLGGSSIRRAGTRRRIPGYELRKA
jgi:hypothetical protein